MDDDCGQQEDEVKPLKHQISFLLNRGGGSSSVPHHEFSRHGSENAAGTEGSTKEANGYRSDQVLFEEPWNETGEYENNNLGVRHHVTDNMSRRSSSERRRTCGQCGKIFAQPADLKKQ